MPEKLKIRIIVKEDSSIIWQRGGEGMSVAEFIKKYPCLLIKYCQGGGVFDQLGEAITSQLGGRHKLREFNSGHQECGGDDGVFQQF